MEKDIRRSVFQVEVFSDGPLEVDGGENDPFDLELINYLITEGDCIGSMEQVVVNEVVPPEKVKSELVRIGNDGDFFDFDDEFDEYEEEIVP